MTVKKKSLIQSVKFKLSVPLFILVATVLAIIGFSRFAIESLSHQAEDVATVEMPAIGTLSKVSSAVNAAYLDERSSLSMKVKSDEFPLLVNQHKATIDTAISGLTQLIDLIHKEAHRGDIRNALESLQLWAATSNEVIDLRSKDNRMNRLLAVNLSNGKSRQQFDQVNNTLTSIRDKWIDDTKNNVGAVVHSAGDTLSVLSALAAISAIFGVAVAIYLPMRIIKRLSSIRARILDIAEGDGDLTRRIDNPQRDEIDSIATAFNKFCDNLHDTISQTKQSAAALAATVQQISEGNRALLEQSERQTATVLEASSGLTQMSSSMALSAGNAERVGQRAANTSSAATQGTDIVERTVAAMIDVSESSNEIVDITSLVDSIAFQTNLLALNAAVEAARAGEQGRGFAVVASEVRELAKRSATAASDIKALSEKTNERVKLGTSLVNNSGDTLKSIIGSIQEVSETVNEISTAASEQNIGLQTITHSITEMTDLMRSTSDFVSEVANASQELESQAHVLMDSVSRFKLNDGVTYQRAS